MLGNVVNAPVLNVLETAMYASNMRQQVISNNIANVNTPNFKRKELVFESLLAKALYPESDDTGDDLQLARTNEKHLSDSDAASDSPQAMIRDDNSTTMRTDGNNVDPDIEMSALAKNTLYYNALVREMNVRVTNLNNVIKG